MDQRRLEIRVGVFAIAGLLVLVVLILMFGNLPELFESHYRLYVHFTDAPGMQEGTPVRKSGIRIGEVTRVRLDDEAGGVLVTLSIKERFPLYDGCKPQIEVSGLLGDVNVNILPGDRAKPRVEPGTRLEGRLPPRADEALQEIHGVAARVNALLGPDGKNAAELVDRLSNQFISLMKEFEGTLVDLRKVVGDPNNRRNVAETLANLNAVSEQLRTKMPALVADVDRVANDLRTTLCRVGDTFDKLGTTADSLRDRGEGTMKKLADAFDEASHLFAQLRKVVADFHGAKGSLNRFVEDPQLYEKLIASADILKKLLEELSVVSRNLEQFSGKIAKDPNTVSPRVKVNVFGGSDEKAADEK